MHAKTVEGAPGALDPLGPVYVNRLCIVTGACSVFQREQEHNTCAFGVTTHYMAFFLLVPLTWDASGRPGGTPTAPIDLTKHARRDAPSVEQTQNRIPDFI